MVNTENKHLKEKYNRIKANFQIKAPEVKVILDDGSMLGIIQTNLAIKKAQELNLDLVEINSKSNPPICKITDLGKYKYSEKKKKSSAKQNKNNFKEIKLTFNIEENDLNHKLVMAKKFLEDKSSIRFSIKFGGRRIMHTDLGRSKLEKVLFELNDFIANKSPILMDGKVMHMTVYAR